MDIEDKGTDQNVDTEGTVVVKIIDNKEEGKTDEGMICPSQHRNRTTSYGPTFYGKRYIDSTMFLNIEDYLGSTMTTTDDIE